MNRFALAALATVAGTGTAFAGGLDRSGQNIEILFEPGNIAELTFGYVAPDVSGRDRASYFGNPTRSRATGDVADNYLQGGLAYKQDLSDALSFALIIDQPYGANVLYGTAAAGGSDLLGGTSATVDSISYTGLLRFKFNDRVSVHGGLRAQNLNADVTLRGGGYGTLGAGSGYKSSYDGDTAFGYQVGAAYEIPEIALRVSATYFSEIDHDLETRQSVNGVTFGGVTNTEVTTPRAININVQSGIAKDTLAFASFRYADYGVTLVRPSRLGGASLTDIDTGRDFTLGLGRKFSDMFSAAVSLNYTDGGPDNVVSPLAPTDGRYGITVSGVYNVTEKVRLSGGINYSRLGDAIAAPSGNQAANFDDNHLVGVGFKVAYRF